MRAATRAVLLFYCPKMWRPRIYVCLFVSLRGFVSWTSQTKMKSKELLIYSAPLFTLIGSYYLFFKVFSFLSFLHVYSFNHLGNSLRRVGLQHPLQRSLQGMRGLPHEPSASNIFQPYESHAHHTFRTFLLSHHGILLDLQPSPMWA